MKQYLSFLLIACITFPAVAQTKVSKSISISQSRQDTAQQTKEPAAEATPTPPDRERHGPANITFNLSSEISADFEFSGPEILKVFNTVYRDDNGPSGYYYYLPASYNLNWSDKTGAYDFSVSYGSADAQGRGQTTVTAILSPRLSRNDIQFAEELLAKNIGGKVEEQFGITDLIAMPMSRAPEIEFTNLGQFGVGEQDISIRPPSDLSDPIYVSFSTRRIDDLMGMFFNNVGLYGDVIVYPDGEGMPASIRIPFNLKIDDPRTFGNFELSPRSWRSAGWQNKTDYPVVLTRFNVLKKEQDGHYAVYSWETGDPEIPEKAKVKFDERLVPRFIDTDRSVEKIWMSYTVKECLGCNTRVKNKIIQGTERSRVNTITFTMLSPLSASGAEMMKIKVRSYQADPNGNSKINLPTLTITRDGSVHEGGQLFVPDGSQPEFEYFMQLYMADGTRYESSNWLSSTNLEVVIGELQIKEAIAGLR